MTDPSLVGSVEEADAWFEYFDTTHDQPEERYREIEPWAWARLERRLKGEPVESSQRNRSRGY